MFSFLHAIVLFDSLRRSVRKVSGRRWYRIKRNRHSLSSKSRRRRLWILDTAMRQGDECILVADYRSDARRARDDARECAEKEHSDLLKRQRMARMTRRPST